MNKAEMQANSCLMNYAHHVVHTDGSLNLHEANVFRRMMETALQAPDVEVCGYLQRVHDDSPWIAMRYVEVDNMAPGDDSEGEFAFGMRHTLDVYELIDKGDCLGIWHSHPNGRIEPSITDWAGHPRDPNVDMYIIALQGDSAALYRYTEDDRP